VRFGRNPRGRERPSSSFPEATDRALHAPGVDLVGVVRVTDRVEEGDGEAAAQVLAELLQAVGEAGIVEERVIEIESQGPEDGEDAIRVAGGQIAREAE
jgi:predicted extracellular nuclease